MKCYIGLVETSGISNLSEHKITMALCFSFKPKSYFLLSRDSFCILSPVYPKQGFRYFG